MGKESFVLWHKEGGNNNNNNNNHSLIFGSKILGFTHTKRNAGHYTLHFTHKRMIHTYTRRAPVNQQHPPVHHPLDAPYYSVVDEPQTELIFGLTLVTNSVGNRSHT
jgi:hypothetical protein